MKYMESVNGALRKIKNFSWDKENIDKNWIRHKVNFKECEEIFFNQPLLLELDKEHSTPKEQRFRTLGVTDSNRRLFVVFTVRDGKIRIISARDQSRKERRSYEKV